MKLRAIGLGVAFSLFLVAAPSEEAQLFEDRETASNDATYELCLARTENPGVGGSIPSLPTIHFR